MKDMLMEYMRNEDAVGTVEIILILVVLIALVIIFRKKLINLLNDIFEEIDDSAQQIYG